ncbi:MAG: hypothetical protein ABI267_00635 [Ginsengibacter sp.]
MRLLKFTILVFAVSVFSITSCKKNDTTQSTITVDSASIAAIPFIDSTQMIKSFSENHYDNLGNFVDSTGTFYFSYDANNKIMSLSTPSLDKGYAVLVFRYDNSGKLFEEDFLNTRPLSIYQGGTILTAINYTYDAQNVINSRTTKDYYGNIIDSIYLNKTNNPSGGYTLSYNSSQSNFVRDSTLNTSTFDAGGKLISLRALTLPDFHFGYVDSVVYDATGNVTKVIRNELLGSFSNSITYAEFEFSSRDTTGNQFYNFNRLLFNGISNMPLDLLANNSVGPGFNGNQNFSFFQFTKYPALRTKVYQTYSGTYLTFNPNPQYDSHGRLIKYRMYTYNDGDPYYYTDYILTYYKYKK